MEAAHPVPAPAGATPDDGQRALSSAGWTSSESPQGSSGQGSARGGRRSPHAPSGASPDRLRPLQPADRPHHDEDAGDGEPALEAEAAERGAGGAGGVAELGDGVGVGGRRGDAVGGHDGSSGEVKVIGGDSPQEQGFFNGVRVWTSPGRGVRAPRLRADRPWNPTRGPRYARSIVRLFVAAIPPPALAQRLAKAAAALAPPELRVAPAENLHVTIHFLGEVDPDAVPALEGALADACAGGEPTVLTLDAIGPGPPRRPRMLWATATPRPVYAEIVEAVRAASTPYAPNARGARPGTPHLTLARLRG